MSDILDNLKELLNKSHAKHQLVNILLNEEPGFQTFICQLPFEYIAKNVQVPSYGEVEFVFEISGNVFSATDDASWGWSGTIPADNMMNNLGLVSSCSYEGNLLGDSWKRINQAYDGW